MRDSRCDGARLRTALSSIIASGGYAEALARADTGRRAAWFASYVTAILQRDVRDLTQIKNLVELPRPLQLLAARSVGLMTVAEISLLTAWSSNRGKRLVKSPKIHLLDCSLAAHLAGFDAIALRHDRTALGPLLETFVVGELVKQAS